MNEIETAFKLVAMFSCAIGAFIAFRISWRVLNSNNSKYDEVRSLLVAPGESWIAGLKRSFSGEIVDESATGRSHIKTAGIGKKNGKFIYQAKPSREAVRGLLEPSK